MYQEPKNPHSLSNEQKQIFQDKMTEKVPKNLGQPVISFQYNPPPAYKPKPAMETNPPMPIYPQGIAYPPQFNAIYPFPHYNPGQAYIPSIIKNTIIHAEAPTGNHGKLFTVHEDALPVKSLIMPLTTIGERLTTYQFVRSAIFNSVDGEDISLEGNNDNSLLSYIKFGSLNPYNTYRLSDNPYMGLPDGFLLYKSCYPIRYDSVSGGTQCAKDTTDINVRIYKLTEGSFLLNRLNPQLYFEFDEWREVAFYENIRETILKKKVCPHFPTLFGYFIPENAKIDFNKITMMKNNKKILEKEEDEYITRPIDPDECLTRIKMEGGKLINVSNTAISFKNNNDKILEINPNAYLGKALVLMTEGFTYNLPSWAKKTYYARGNIKEMINRGVHSEKEWLNLLFQVMIGLCVMQLNKILINNFTLENNVFIKDLTLKGQITNYWKYKVDDADFYLPNLGYLVLIDSNFKDIGVEQVTLSFNKTTNTNRKIDGKCFGKDCKLIDADLNTKIFEMFKNSFDVNQFSKDFINAGGCKPPADILKLIEQIHNEASNDKEQNIKNYVMKYMRFFMHNRIGTYLKEGEMPNIRRDDIRELKKGQLVVLEDGFGTYKVVMFLETKNGNSKILTKNDPTDLDIIEIEVPVTSLLNYSKAEPISQTFKPNESNMNEDDLLEVYIIKE